MHRNKIVEHALEWVGTPFKHQGRSKTGIDCAGLVILVGQKSRLTSVNPTNYPRRPDGTFIKYFTKNLTEIQTSQIQPGDVAVFSGVDHNHVCHCGIIGSKYNELSLIHAHATRRKVIHERLKEAKTVVGPIVYAFQYPGVI